MVQIPWKWVQSTLSPVSDNSVSTLWEGPSTHEQTVATSGKGLVVSVLSLDPLSLADGGDYTCTASYTTDRGTTVTRSDTEIVTPTSKSSPVMTSFYSYPYIQLYLHLCSEFCLFVVNALGKEKTSSHIELAI